MYHVIGVQEIQSSTDLLKNTPNFLFFEGRIFLLLTDNFIMQISLFRQLHDEAV